MKIKFIILFIIISKVAFSDIPISKIEELQKIGNESGYPLDGDYYLTNDIDASETQNWNDGKGFDPIINIIDEEYIGFSGNLDGNNYTIKNIYIHRNDIEYTGIFGYIHGGTIKNIIFYNIQVIGGKYTGGLGGYAEYNRELKKSSEINNIHIFRANINGIEYTGGLLGVSNAYINNCSVKGTINSTLSAAGLVGGSKYEKIEKSYAITITTGVISSGLVGYSETTIQECYSGGTITGKNCGGIVNYNFNSQIINCFSNCNINANISGGDSGGLVRENIWKINKSYATGKISGKGNLKGLVAIWGWFFPDPPEVSDSYYDYQTTGQYEDNFSHYGVPKNTLNMKDPATFENWDFENVWWMIPGKTYPLLRPERYIDVSVKPAEWMPELKYGFPLEYEIVFGEEMSDRFTFDDIDFTSSTLESPVGTLTTENGTTWTLMINDTASTPTWPAELVLRVPLAGATNLANYPCAESNATSITIQAPAIPGDFNGDGVCDEVDKMILVEMIIEPSSPWKTRIPFTRRDLNTDNILDVADVVAILPLMNKSQ